MKNSWFASLVPWVYLPNTYGYSHARKNGVEEGRSNSQGQAYAFELKNTFEGWANDLAFEWAEKDKALKAAYCSALQALNRANGNLQSIRANRENRDSALADMESQYRAELGGDHVNTLTYAVALLVFGIFELPINKVVIEALGLAGWEQWLAAAGISIFLVGAAHFLGRLLKQGSTSHGLTLTEKALVAASLTVPVSALAFIAILREKYVIKLNALGLSITENQVLLLFFTINILFFVVGTVFSFTYHDPHGTRIRRTFEHDKGQAKRHKTAEQKAEKLVELQQERLNRAAAAREHTHGQYFKRIRREKDDFERLLSIYRKYKERELTRRGDPIPANMLSSIKMDVPQTIARVSSDGQILELAKLDKRCPGFSESE